MQLKLKYTAGPDKSPSVLIRECVSFWIQTLTILFNLSLKHKTFIDVWKATKVVPIFKNGQQFFNSVWNCYFEFLVVLFQELHLRMSAWFHGKVLDCYKFVYSYPVYREIHWPRISDDVIYTDFSKAFDRLQHDILLFKLKNSVVQMRWNFLGYILLDVSCLFFVIYYSLQSLLLFLESDRGLFWDQCLLLFLLTH